MRIAFDVDGVVLRSIEVILERVNALTGRNLQPSDLKSWELEPLGLDFNVLNDAVTYMFARKKIEPYAGAVLTLSRLYKQLNSPLLFITGRHAPETALRQLEALPWNPTVPEMIVIGGNRDKRSFLADHAVDFIVEDDPAHLQDYLDMGIGVGLMVQPWNRETKIPVTKRFHNWSELESWLIESNATIE
ncbi:5' nucleotidase, NT5C type [Desulfomonile tiedjei]|uniref:Nucleotidase n=1 Tax=Desulfomonile tiedjei (strain ATCC 49306 / DSM 6799 / DCB-1) TaxID=706587 RepID=I4C7J1_DESTA|nr:hypothetical protein [Desulfomonile tiedjei]AFM25532.1 hypothetical protein Desti_2863 [Desulfomonile tiedjei DSM 6799]